MERIAVASSSLLSVGYDADGRVLEVEFTRGAVFQYYDVPVEEHQGFMDSDSKGKYFNARIKNKYQFAQV